MALNKSLLEESVLSNSEKSVIRQIYRMALLADARKALSAIRESLPSEMTSRSYASSDSQSVAESLEKTDKYLQARLATILNSVKVPKHQTVEEQ